MAGSHKSIWRLIAAITLAVLLLHWAGLAWLSSQWFEPSVLRPLATPLFTRTLTPAALVAAPKHARSAPHRLRRSPAAREPVVESSPIEPVAQVPEPVLAPAPQPATEEMVPPTDVTPGPAQVDTVDMWPANTRLTYKAGGFFRGRLWGDAKVQWQREGERYQVQLEVSFGWLAHLSMTSQGQIKSALLMPEVFEEETTTARRHLSFTPQEIVLMNGRRLPRPEGVQDSVSQFVDLSHRFANGLTPLAVGQSVQLWLARPGGTDLWTYDVVDLDTLETPLLGAVQAFHLKPRSLANPRGPITAEMWFAPALQYLPVRIKVALSDEAWVDLLVDKIEQSEAAPSPVETTPTLARDATE